MFIPENVALGILGERKKKRGARSVAACDVVVPVYVALLDSHLL